MRRVGMFIVLILAGCGQQGKNDLGATKTEQPRDIPEHIGSGEVLGARVPTPALPHAQRPPGTDFASAEWQSYFRLQAELPEPGDPLEYFPSATGTTWEYHVTLGTREPLLASELVWPLAGGQAMVSKVRGRLLRERMRNTSPTVTLRVLGSAPTQGPLQFARSVEVAIVRDDLLYFENVEHCYWAIPDGGNEVLLVMTYTPFSPGAPTGSWGVPIVQGEGYAIRQFFHNRGVGASVGSHMSKGEAEEKLLYTGYALEWGTPCLHFLRVVEESASEREGKEADVLNHAFTEEYWFEQGKGLVRLEQKVGGITSMTWSLVQFTPGL